jgi:hypothetical protein
MESNALNPIEKKLIEIAKEILALKFKYPNDIQLGKHTRTLINDKIDNVTEHQIVKEKTTQ